MSIPEPLSPSIPNPHNFARRFTSRLGLDVLEENLDLLPPALFAGRKLNRELPRPTAAKLHVVLELANGPDNLLQEFHDRIPQINDVLELWGEMKRASPTSNGEAQLRARATIAGDESPTEKGKATTFNLASSLDTPGRADIIYLTDAAEENGVHAKDASIPSNLRTVEWFGFEGSHIHIAHIHAEPKQTAFSREQGIDFDEDSVRRSSTFSTVLG